MIEHRVEIADAHAHQFRVTLTLPRPAARQALMLPAWIPGSYMIRDFARHLSAMTARQGRRSVALTQVGKTQWVADCEGGAALVVSYRVHAFDSSVRGAFLDAERGFFNGSSLFLCAEGRAHEPQQLRLGALPRGWQVVTAMPAAGPRRWAAADHAELIDHPVLLGRPWQGSFVAGGAEHVVAVTGAWPSFDGPRLLADLQRLCTAQIRFWHGARGRPPFRRYVFLLQLADSGHGGLEHRASTALMAARADLPRRGEAATSDGYAGLLGLASHEYFHAWNVKRLRPRELAAPDLAHEAHSTLLWFFEGFTSYHDELFLLRTGLVDRARYLRLLARSINAVAGTPGRWVHSLAEASFEAWTKTYRSDENTANATVSYYSKGALVALLCDLALRRAGHTLDDAMRLLWRRSGGGAIAEADILDAMATLGGAALATELHGWVHGRGELPLVPALAGVGLRLQRDTATPLAATLGLKLAEGAFSGVQVRQVLRGSAAEAAGLAAGDELLAVDGWRIRRLEDAVQWLQPGAAFTLLTARDQRIAERRVQPPAEPAAPGFTLVDDAAADPAALARRRAWLGG